MHKIKLTYFDFQVRGEPARLAFKLSDIPFEDERLSEEEFSKRKKNGEFKFGQVPILTVDGKKFAQSSGIFRFVGKVTGLYPQTYLEQLEIDEGLGLVEEMITVILDAVHMEDGEGKKMAKLKVQQEILPKLFSFYDKQLQEGKSGYYGNKLSIADIYVYTIMKWIDTGKIIGLKYEFSKHKALNNLFNQIDTNPKISKWNEKYQYIEV